MGVVLRSEGGLRRHKKGGEAWARGRCLLGGHSDAPATDSVTSRGSNGADGVGTAPPFRRPECQIHVWCGFGFYCFAVMVIICGFIRKSSKVLRLQIDTISEK